MKCRTLIFYIMLGILTGVPSIVFSKERNDSLILNRIYRYQEAHTPSLDSLKDNVYLKSRFNVERRNPTLWLIPSMYVLAKGEKEYIRESYSRVTFTKDHDWNIDSQVLSGTIRHNRRAMPTLLDMLSPDVYNEVLYNRHILSPFNRHNKRYYRYTQQQLNDSTTRLDFKPKIYNTQMINGYAIIETMTGRIIRTVLNGEFDMITFRTEVNNGEAEDLTSPLPQRCTTAATFRFMGNRISSVFDASYKNDFRLNDTIDRITNRSMMDSIRPIPLTATDRHIYDVYDEQHKPDTTVIDTTPHKVNILKKIFWDTIGDNLVTPIAAESEHAYFRLSPIISPLQLSWSDRRGFRYKIKFRSRYTFNAHRYLTLDANFGYNFKFKEFYFTIPLRMTYNPKRNGYAEIVYGNGNRISNNTVNDYLRRIYGDDIFDDNPDTEKFYDNQLRVFNNIMLYDWLDIESGFIYHRRQALNKEFMRQYGMPEEYRSFAPMIGVKIRAWENGPMFSFDWERGIKGVNKSDIDYERWEADGSWKCNLPGLQVLNFRLGGGLYSRKAQSYFVDYTNFRDNNLPEGWEDDWSGSFELLDSKSYNESSYYGRFNISYDSPLLVACRIPYLGKYIERERFYFSTALLERSKPYFELGYSFTNRYISIGFFSSFKNTRFQEVGFDFEYELFRRW